MSFLFIATHKTIIDCRTIHKIYYFVLWNLLLKLFEGKILFCIFKLKETKHLVVVVRATILYRYDYNIRACYSCNILMCKFFQKTVLIIFHPNWKRRKNSVFFSRSTPFIFVFHPNWYDFILGFVGFVTGNRQMSPTLIHSRHV